MTFNKFEYIGIVVSIAVMATALSIAGGWGERLLFGEEPTPEAQTAVAVSASASSEEARTSALIDAMTLQGELTRLVTEDVLEGDGEGATPGSRVTVHYIGRTEDGVEFGNSYLHAAPVVFTLGGGRVIKGWEEGISGMKVGGKRILVVPPALAYGDRDVGPIPAHTTLVFLVELISIE